MGKALLTLSFRSRRTLFYVTLGLATPISAVLLLFPPRAELNADMSIHPIDLPFDNASYPSISPDGKWIAFGAVDSRGSSELYTFNLSNGHLEKITHDSSDIPVLDVDISPDGKRIVYVRRGLAGMNAYVVPSAGGVPLKIAEGVFLPDWHPSGQHIGFLRIRGRGASRRSELWTVRDDGSDLKPLYADSVSTSVYYSFSWSPKGDAFAWLRSNSDGLVEIILVDQPSLKERQLTYEKNVINELVWASNDQIIYSTRKSGILNLWMVPSQGGESIQITRGEGPDAEPVISSDCKRLIYMRTRTVGYLMQGSLQGSASERQLTFDPRQLSDAADSPDGEEIVYAGRVDEHDRQYALYAINIENEARRRLLAEEGIIGSVSYSPDGKYISYSVRRWRDVNGLRPEIFVAEAISPSVKRQVGIGIPLLWIGDRILSVFRGGRTYHLNIETGHEAPFFEDSTLAVPIRDGSFVVYRSLKQQQAELFMRDLRRPGSLDKRLLSFSEPMNFAFSKSREYVIVYDRAGELWRLNLPSGKKEKVLGRFFGFGRNSFVNTSYHDRHFFYSYVRYDTRTFIIENPFSPPWWRSTEAYAAYGVVFLIGLFFIRRSEMNRQLLRHQIEIKNLEAEKLKELDRLKSRFFANISHEFRTPLTLIEGPARQLESGTALSPREAGVIISKNSRRLLRLVNQLLDLSKLEAGQMHLRVAEGDLAETVRVVTSAFESLAARESISFDILLPQEPSICWFDPDVIEKVLTNLLSNAFKFTNEGGTVTISLRETTSSNATKIVDLTVSDSGIGIPADQLGRIFDRFYQVDNAQTREYEGTGIGLALTKELIELHNGSIRVESEQGKGTTITVTLIVARESYKPNQIADASITRAPSEPESTSMTTEWIEPSETAENDQLPVVVVIEDNPDMRLYIRRQLEGSYRIVEAINGPEGLKTAAEHLPDLVISDIMMPKMDGFEVCKKLKTDQATSHIPVILLTAKAGMSNKLEGLETGADDYLVKPFDPLELKSRLKNLIEQRKRLRERFQRELVVRPKGVTVNSTDERFLQKVFDTIEHHLVDERLNPALLSRECSLSRMQLHRKLMAITGLSAGQLIRNFRLQRASEMIRKKVGTVSEIAFQTGFNNLSYFSKLFKQKYGVNPSEFPSSKQIDLK